MIIQQGHRYAFGVEGSWAIPNSLIASGIRDRGFVDVVVKNRSDVPASHVPPLPTGTTDAWDTLGWATRSAPTADEELPDRVRWVLDVTPTATAPSPSPSATPPVFTPPADVVRPIPFQPPPPGPMPAPMVLVPIPGPVQPAIDWAGALGYLGLVAALVALPALGERRLRRLARRAAT